MTALLPNTIKIGSFEVSRPIAFTYLLTIFYNVTFFLQFSATPYLVKHLQLSDADFGKSNMKTLKRKTFFEL